MRLKEGDGVGVAGEIAQGVSGADVRIGLRGAVLADDNLQQVSAVFVAQAGDFAFGSDAVGDANQRMDARGGDGVD